MMKQLLILAACIYLFSCNTNTSKTNMATEHEMVKVNMKFLDSVKQVADSSYKKKYGTERFDTATYYLLKDSLVYQVMQDTAGVIRQVLGAKKNVRVRFEQYYPNGQLMALLPLDSFGQNHGMSKYYAENGAVTSEGEYVHGFKNGVWNEYDDNGVTTGTTEYDKDGQPVKITHH